jgi:hypothetical protein
MTLALIVGHQGKEPTDVIYKIELFLFAASSIYFAWISLWRTFVLGDKGDDEEPEESLGESTGGTT